MASLSCKSLQMAPICVEQIPALGTSFMFAIFQQHTIYLMKFEPLRDIFFFKKTLYGSIFPLPRVTLRGVGSLPHPHNDNPDF